MSPPDCAPWRKVGFHVEVMQWRQYNFIKSKEGKPESLPSFVLFVSMDKGRGLVHSPCTLQRSREEALLS